MNPPRLPALLDLLFHPFQRIAGWTALGLGLVIVLLTSWIGSLSGTHFDGVLDLHTTPVPYPLWLYLGEGLINWLSLSLVLLVAGRIATRATFRSLDLFGTQALARWPAILSALICLLPDYQSFSLHLLETVQTGRMTPDLQHPSIAAFLVVLLVVLLATIWMVYLMYRSFSVSCNLRGWRAVVWFIAGLLLAEILSKVAIVSLIQMTFTP